MLEYYASIRVFSKSCNAEEIGKILKIDFDEKKIMGEPRSKGSILKWEKNVWILTSGVPQSSTLEDHIEKLLEKIESKKEYFSLLGSDCKVGCQCYIDGDQEEVRPEISLPSALIKGLAAINAYLDIDMYISDHPDSE
jgi:hypothetical protein